MGKQKKLNLCLRTVLMCVLALTAYACSATKPAVISQTIAPPSLPANQTSPQNVVPPQNKVITESDADVKKNEVVAQSDDFDARIQEILAYMHEKETKTVQNAKPQKALKNIARNQADDDYTETAGKLSQAEDTEHIRESVSENVAMAELPEISDNAVGEAEFAIRYSEKLGLKADGTENQQLLDAISKWFGSPYRMGGCTKGGVDCSCFVKSVYEDVYGIELTRTSRSMYSKANRVRKDQLQEGDMIYFKIRGRRISHVGIYLGDNKFAHSSRHHGVVIDNLNAPYYKKRFVSGGRVGEKVGMDEAAETKKKDR